MIYCMAFKSENRFVKRMLRLFIHITIRGTVAVVEIRLLLKRSCFSKVFKCSHFPNIPNFEQLIFSIRCNINSIKLAAHICNTFRMSYKNSNRPASRQLSSIPNFDKRVITATQKYVAMLSVCEADRVDLISMRFLNNCVHLIRYKIIANYLATFGASNKFLAVPTVFTGHYSSLPL